MLFEAHQMMLDDMDFVESIEGLIENDRLNAEAAVSDTGAQFAEMFAARDDSYMQARAADIRDISTRVVGILTGEGESGIVSDVPCIVAADDLAPSETVQLDKSLILGFITAGGAANSHTAILARTTNPQAADFELDRAYFAQMLALSDGLSDGGFARGYVQLQIDSANPNEDYQSFLRGEVRYASLRMQHPEPADALFAESEQNALGR